MIEIAEQTIQEENPNTKMGNHQIMREGNSLLTSNLSNTSYLWLGAEMGCHSEEETIKFFQNMTNKGIMKGNNVLFSHFICPQTPEEETNAKAMYINQESQDFVLLGLKELGIDMNYFKYHIDYNKTTHTIEVGIECIQDYSIILSTGEVISKKI